MTKSFKDFQEKAKPATVDYVVGYDKEKLQEIKVPVSALTTKGNDGAGLSVEYSANAQTWHTNYIAGDKYMRQRIGTGAWSSAIRIAPEEISGDIQLLITAPMESELTVTFYDYIGGVYNLTLSNCTILTGEIVPSISISGYSVSAGITDGVATIPAGSKVTLTISIPKPTTDIYPDVLIVLKRIGTKVNRSYLFVKEEA